MQTTAPTAPIAPIAGTAHAAPTTVPSWPSPAWHTWEPTHDRFMRERPMDFMQAAPIAPHADSVAQADFAYGSNYGAHGSLDVFSGATLTSHADRDAAFAAAQAFEGVRGIVGVFRDADGFVVRELLVSDARQRGAGDDIRQPRPEARPRPERLIALTDVGEPHGPWGHGDFRTLSALRFVSDDLVGFVRGPDRIER